MSFSFFFFFFLFGCSCPMQMFPGQAWNLCHCSNQSQCSDNAGILNPFSHQGTPKVSFKWLTYLKLVFVMEDAILPPTLFRFFKGRLQSIFKIPQVRMEPLCGDQGRCWVAGMQMCPNQPGFPLLWKPPLVPRRSMRSSPRSSQWLYWGRGVIQEQKFTTTHKVPLSRQGFSIWLGP